MGREAGGAGGSLTLASTFDNLFGMRDSPQLSEAGRGGREGRQEGEAGRGGREGRTLRTAQRDAEKGGVKLQIISLVMSLYKINQHP